jgi:hypothetical protein
MELLPEAIRGDNAGENKSLAKRRKLLWAECAGTCTLVDNLVTGTNGVPPPCQLFYGMAPKFGKTLRTFGEIGIVAEGTDKKIRAKLTDRGRPCLFLGYAPDHAGDVYRMLNLDTNKAITTRDVYWLNKSYGEYKGIQVTNVVRVSSDSDNDDSVGLDRPSATGAELSTEDEEEEEVNQHEEEVVEEGGEDVDDPRAVRLHRAMKELDTSYNPTLKPFEARPESYVTDLEIGNVAIIGDDVAFMGAVSSDPMEPVHLLGSLGVCRR